MPHTKIAQPEKKYRGKRTWFYSNNYWQLRQAKYLTQPAPEAKQDNSDLIARAYLDF